MARKPRQKGGDRTSLSPTTARTAQSPLVGKKISLSHEVEDDMLIDIDFLSRSRVNLPATNLTETIAPMIADKLAYPADSKKDLMQHFSLYFQTIG